MSENRIALLGIYPPPIGGVSIHIQRLGDFLENNNVNHIIYDISKVEKNRNNYYHVQNMKKWIIKYFFCCRDRVIHCHERNWYLVAILSFVANVHKSKLILSFHSFRELPQKFNIIKRIAFNISMKKVDAFIVDGKNDCEKLLKYCKDEGKVYNISPFIPPIIRKKDFSDIPEWVWRFMGSKEIIIIGNAFQIAFYNKEDLYGIDMCIELMRLLKKTYKYKRIGFVFSLPEIGNKEYYNNLKNLIEKYDLENEFVFLNKNVPLYPIISKSSIFVRPTNTDGDSISVREALSLKIPTVCSDICERPEGTIKFKTRNIKDFLEKISYVIENYDSVKNELSSLEKGNNGKHILDLYKKFI